MYESPDKQSSSKNGPTRTVLGYVDAVRVSVFPRGVPHKSKRIVVAPDRVTAA